MSFINRFLSKLSEASIPASLFEILFLEREMQRNRVTTTPLPQEVNELEEDNVEIYDGDCSDEEDFELLIGFDPEKGRQRLYSLSNSILVKIK